MSQRTEWALGEAQTTPGPAVPSPQGPFGRAEPPSTRLHSHRKLDFHLMFPLCMFCFYFRLWRRRRKNTREVAGTARPSFPRRVSEQGTPGCCCCGPATLSQVLCVPKTHPHTEYWGTEHPQLTWASSKSRAWWIHPGWSLPGSGEEQEALADPSSERAPGTRLQQGQHPQTKPSQELLSKPLPPSWV